jgi:hypothetical protein
VQIRVSSSDGSCQGHNLQWKLLSHSPETRRGKLFIIETLSLPHASTAVGLRETRRRVPKASSSPCMRACLQRQPPPTTVRGMRPFLDVVALLGSVAMACPRYVSPFRNALLPMLLLPSHCSVDRILRLVDLAPLALLPSQTVSSLLNTPS